VQRGFERYFGDLFAALQGDAQLTLFKSAGPSSAQEVVPPGLTRMTAWVRALPVGRLWGRTEYHRDCLAFALCLLPLLRGGHFDLVHCIDPPLASVLARLKRLGLLRLPLLFTEGSLMPPRLYPVVDHIHHVGQAALEQALASGVPAAHMTLIPCGVHADRFTVAAQRSALRLQHGVGPDCFVVLVISALMRHHKRVDHLIEEVAQLRGELLLWLDGHPEEHEIEQLARSRLGERCRITHVAPDQVPELLGMADVLVHGALEESFGLAVVEALYSGLPVVAHDSPHFRWLTGRPDCLVDMTRKGALARRLQDLLDTPPAQRPQVDVQAIRQRFDWPVLREQYASMYRQVAGLSQTAGIDSQPRTRGIQA
jgi:glycosyltransferase involved in cell wall biosynthesis